MANSLNAFMAQNLALGLTVLRRNCALLQNLNFTYDPTPGKVNSTVEIPFTRRGAVGDVLPSNVPPVSQDTNTGKLLMSVDTWKQRSFFVTDQEMESLNQDYFNRQTTQAVTDLAEFVNADVFAKAYKSFYNTVGTAGTPPFATTVAAAALAAKALNDNLAPAGDRAAILDTLAYANAIQLPAFFQNFSSADPNVLREGDLGRKLGFNWFYDTQVPGHTAGTGTGYLTAGATAIGATTVNIGTGTGTLLPGDIFTVAGDSQTYTVVSYSAPLLTFSAPARVAWASGSAITRIASHSASIAFHRDAIAFATRPLGECKELVNQVGGRQIMDMSDPVSGLALRLVISNQYNQINWEYQILYGSLVVRPEFGVRILG
jgi:hypothetical protein